MLQARSSIYSDAAARLMGSLQHGCLWRATATSVGLLCRLGRVPVVRFNLICIVFVLFIFLRCRLVGLQLELDHVANNLVRSLALARALQDPRHFLLGHPLGLEPLRTLVGVSQHVDLCLSHRMHPSSHDSPRSPKDPRRVDDIDLPHSFRVVVRPNRQHALQHLLLLSSQDSHPGPEKVDDNRVLVPLNTRLFRELGFVVGIRGEPLGLKPSDFIVPKFLQTLDIDFGKLHRNGNVPVLVWWINILGPNLIVIKRRLRLLLARKLFSLVLFPESGDGLECASCALASGIVRLVPSGDLDPIRGCKQRHIDRVGRLCSIDEPLLHLVRRRCLFLGVLLVYVLDLGHRCDGSLVSRKAYDV
eukprot:m.412876 g.412876  ORF g.412876 m.412876 type:complete len:360 (+) comp28966_c0_seq1:348-1427(+)